MKGHELSSYDSQALFNRQVINHCNHLIYYLLSIQTLIYIFPIAYPIFQIFWWLLCEWNNCSLQTPCASLSCTRWLWAERQHLIILLRKTSSWTGWMKHLASFVLTSLGISSFILRDWRLPKKLGRCSNSYFSNKIRFRDTTWRMR